MEYKIQSGVSTIILKLSKSERTVIVAALVHYGADSLARELAIAPEYDPTDDGPEVDILRPAHLRADN